MGPSYSLPGHGAAAIVAVCKEDHCTARGPRDGALQVPALRCRRRTLLAERYGHARARTMELDRHINRRAPPEGPTDPAYQLAAGSPGGCLARNPPTDAATCVGGDLGLAVPMRPDTKSLEETTEGSEVGKMKLSPGRRNTAQLPHGRAAGLPAGGHPGLVAAAAAAHAGHADPPGVRAGGGQGGAGPRRQVDHRNLRRARPRAGDADHAGDRVTVDIRTAGVPKCGVPSAAPSASRSPLRNHELIFLPTLASWP